MTPQEATDPSIPWKIHKCFGDCGSEYVEALEPYKGGEIIRCANGRGAWRAGFLETNHATRRQRVDFDWVGGLPLPY